jgi:DnaJ-class molecular chaperone
VQEYFPETRGDNYKKRQSKQADVQEDLHSVEDAILNKQIGKEFCDHCQGTGKYENYPCNVCQQVDA